MTPFFALDNPISGFPYSTDSSSSLLGLFVALFGFFLVFGFITIIH
ncbi:hypothetical protein KA405_01620 [Patescibacteria group bacterium]|nr:hypothetical protein [Patescibacteria group bacterium]